MKKYKYDRDIILYENNNLNNNYKMKKYDE